ncbi:GntR family transcriptional regulator [Streptomyces sp. NPDC002402]
MSVQSRSSAESRGAAIERIIRLVVNGQLGTGPDNLKSEQWLAEATSVDTESIRRALALMTRDGLIGQEPGRGVWIWPVQVDELRQMLIVRGQIEFASAESALASDILPKLGLIEKRFHAFLSTIRTGEQLNVDRFVHADAEFHAGIAVCGGYSVGAEIIGTWGHRCRIFLARPDHHEVAARGHMEIADLNEKIFECMQASDDTVSAFIERYIESWQKLLADEFIDVIRAAQSQTCQL